MSVSDGLERGSPLMPFLGFVKVMPLLAQRGLAGLDR